MFLRYLYPSLIYCSRFEAILRYQPKAEERESRSPPHRARGERCKRGNHLYIGERERREPKAELARSERGRRNL